MQVLVIYHSRKGNTELVARAVGKGVEEVENVTALVKECSDVTKDDLLSSAGIVAGSPVYFGTMAAELKSVIDKFVNLRPQMSDKVGAAFATSAATHGGGETTVISILQAFLIYGMIVVGDPPGATGHYGLVCSGKPEEADMTCARKLGQRVAALAKKLSAA